MTNAVCWFQIQGADHKKLAAFYKKAFGWTMRTAPGGGKIVDQAPGGISGGIGPSTDGKSHVSIYIQVDDLNAFLKKVERAGGRQVMEPTDLPSDMGAIAGFEDPAGNWMGLWQQGATYTSPTKSTGRKASTSSGLAQTRVRATASRAAEATRDTVERAAKATRRAASRAVEMTEHAAHATEVAAHKAANRINHKSDKARKKATRGATATTAKGKGKAKTSTAKRAKAGSTTRRTPERLRSTTSSTARTTKTPRQPTTKDQPTSKRRSSSASRSSR